MEVLFREKGGSEVVTLKERDGRKVLDWNYKDKGGWVGAPNPQWCINYAQPRYSGLWGKLGYDPEIEELDEAEVSGRSPDTYGEVWSKAGLPGNALKQATFNMDGLGDFEITSYLDGFLVEYSKTGEIIEVSIVRTDVDGRVEELVQVHSSVYEKGIEAGSDGKLPEPTVRAVVGDTKGRSFDCVVRTLGGRVRGVRPKVRMESTAEEDIPLEVPCTIAAFGKTRIGELVKREGGTVVAGGPGRWLEVAPHGLMEEGCGAAGGGHKGGGVKVRASFSETVFSDESIIIEQCL